MRHAEAPRYEAQRRRDPEQDDDGPHALHARPWPAAMAAASPEGHRTSAMSGFWVGLCGPGAETWFFAEGSIHGAACFISLMEDYEELRTRTWLPNLHS